MSLLASLVIPVFNQVKFTQDCLESILRDSDRQPYEIIIVDNGSTDGTRQYLETKSRELDRSRDRLITICNETNLGVAPAWNQGLKAATGRTIGILNNDIVVTRGWYRSLLWAMDYHRIGMISPYAAGGPFDYDLEGRSREFTRKNLGRLWPDYDFCAVVLTRKTYERIGLFDEKYLVGGYEDQDYALRLSEAGIRYGVTGASFIHHFGSQTLGEFKKRGDQHAAHNRQYFMEKWKRDPSEGVASVATKLRRTWRNVKMKWGYM
ncbi:MAG: glycosyltransferase family 2 protein [Deltaproteobacteria bacterium]|nr:glycosyltransferase family 2 protein [Deltaproteobacteria bacterium]